MAGLVRKTLIPFGQSGAVSNFGQFGSKTASAPLTSQDPAVIQALSAWVQGWQNAIVNSDKAAYLEDMNGWCFVHSYEVAYIYQMGISEWDSATLYFTGSVVQTAVNGQQFKSLQGGVPGIGAGQSGNVPPVSSSNAFWLWINPPQNLVGSETLNTLQKVTSTSPANGVPGSVTLGDSLLSEAGGNVVLASGGIKFPDATVQTTAAVSANAVSVSSPPSAYVGPASRVLGTVYQNTGSKPRFVLVTVFVVGNSSIAYCDSLSSPVQTVGYIASNAGINVVGTVFFIVLPGYYYKVLGGTTLEFWTEWT